MTIPGMRFMSMTNHGRRSMPRTSSFKEWDFIRLHLNWWPETSSRFVLLTWRRRRFVYPQKTKNRRDIVDVHQHRRLSFLKISFHFFLFQTCLSFLFQPVDLQQVYNWYPKQPFLIGCLVISNFLNKDLVHHPIETTIKNGLFGVPGSCFIWTTGSFRSFKPPGASDRGIRIRGRKIAGCTLQRRMKRGFKKRCRPQVLSC